MAELKLKHINKTFDKGFEAVSGFELDVAGGEFVVIVGPSGCGKSTILRIISGLTDATAGEVVIDGKIANDTLPKDRDIAMMFQDFALYPTMTVRQNLAFGLKTRKYEAAEIEKRINEAAEILGLTHLLDRKPSGLSGGEKQRVALGRVIVRRPEFFLLDEPLSGVDVQQKSQLRGEIIRLHKETGITFIYVTHDQSEAMTMGDRIVVMKNGEIMQTDIPKILYDYPRNAFTSAFLGVPQINLINCKLSNSDTLEIGSVKMPVPKKLKTEIFGRGYEGKDIILGVRPERVKLSGGFEGVVYSVEILGNETIIYVNSDMQNRLALRISGEAAVSIGEKITFGLDLSFAVLFDGETNNAISGLPEYNMIPATVDGNTARFFGGDIDLDGIKDAFVTKIGGSVMLGVPPENIILNGEISAKLCGISAYGDTDICRFAINGFDGYLTARLRNCGLKIGDKTTLKIISEGLSVFDISGMRLSAKFLSGKFSEINILSKKEKKAEKGIILDMEFVGSFAALYIQTKMGIVKAVTNDVCTDLRIGDKIHFICK